MSSSMAQNTIQAAVELGFLTTSQLKIIDKDLTQADHSATEVAIRKGFLSRQQLEVLNVFSNPLDVVPGYRIDGLIGQGGAGVVYKATQVTMDRAVAIKTIKQFSAQNELAPKRFEREAQIIGQLRHPNIIAAHDFGMHNGQLYLVMEYVEGTDAEEYLIQKLSLPEDHAWHVALQVAHALDYASQNGITHRDIKPANLILTAPPSGTPLPAHVPFVKIADFGLARFKDNHDSPSITLEGAINGTPYYMPPEQITSGQVDHLSDIYALGITIWHLIRGIAPFYGAGPMEVINNKIAAKDDWLEHSPANISEPGFELLKKMCRYEREERISEYASLVSEIESVISSLPASSSGELPTEQSQFSATTAVTFFESVPGFTTSVAESDFSSPKDPYATLDQSELEPANSRISTRQKLMMAAAAAAALMLGAAAWVVSGLSSDRSPPIAEAAAEPVPQVRLNSFTGAPIYLFNGTDVDPRQKFSGLWEPAQGGEGESVLAGKNGTRDFSCVDETGAPLRWFRFNCGFRHGESNQIEFRLLVSNDTEAFRVIITPEQSTLSVEESEVEKLDLKKYGEASFGYHTFQIESQPGYWRVMVNSKLLGQVRKARRCRWSVDDPIVCRGPRQCTL